MPLADERSAPLTVTAPVAFSENILARAAYGLCTAPLATDSALACP